MKVIAHRGMSRKFPENSIASFHGAVKAGAHAIELDVRLTVDNQFIIMHDENSYRTTGTSAIISACTRDYLSQIKLKNGENIPFLDQVIDIFSSECEFHIEMKSSSIKACDLLKQLISRYRFPRGLIVSSFEPKVVQRMISTPNSQTSAFLWDQSSEYISNFSDVQYFMETNNCKIYHPWHKIVTENQIAIGKKLEWSIYPYVNAEEKNSEKQDVWKRMRQLKVDGLCTNCPDELYRWLNGE